MPCVQPADTAPLSLHHQSTSGLLRLALACHHPISVRLHRSRFSWLSPHDLLMLRLHATVFDFCLLIEIFASNNLPIFSHVPNAITQHTPDQCAFCCLIFLYKFYALRKGQVSHITKWSVMVPNGSPCLSGSAITFYPLSLEVDLRLPVLESRLLDYVLKYHTL